MNHSGISEIILGLAASGIQKITERGISLDSYLDRCPPEHRRSVSHLLFYYFRYRRFLDGLLAERLRTPPPSPVYGILRAAATQIFFQRAIAPEAAASIAVSAAARKGMAGLVNAVLRALTDRKLPTPTAPEEILPEALYKSWSSRFSPEELAEQTDTLMTKPPFSFRMRCDFAPPEGAEALPGWGGFRFFSVADPGLVLHSDSLRRGEIYIQDPATSLAPSLPDYTQIGSFLDLCAAPGGKTLMIAERLRPGVRIVAADRSAKRQQLTGANCAKFGLAAEVVTAEPHELDGSFDLVLADVPCGNSGVFRRRPDAMWRYNPERQHELAALQSRILGDAARLTAPGGQLVYSTCSVEPEENDLNVAAFLKEHPEFQLLKSRLLLPSPVNDGAFAALLIRRQGE